MTAFGGVFGEDFSGGWGESVEPSEDGGDDIADGDVGDGHSMEFNPVAWKALMHSAAVTAGVVAHAQAICDTANQNVAMDPKTVQRLNPNGDDAYVVTVNTDPDTTRVRAKVKPSATNSLGFVDEATNSTLYKAVMATPGAAPGDAAPSGDTVTPPEPGAH